MAFIQFVLLFLCNAQPNHLQAQVYGCSDCNKIVVQEEKVLIDLSGIVLTANLGRIEDILNATVENVSGEDITIKLKARLCLNDPGEELLGVISSPFLLRYTGVPEFLQSQNLDPTYLTCEDYKTRDLEDYFMEVIFTTGSLPAGTYTICVDAVNEDETEYLGSSCIIREVRHPYPPELILPADNSAVSEPLPIFSWLPPMPAYSNILYKIEIVEILDGQTPIEAMEASFAVFYRDSIVDLNSLQYPIASRPFEVGSRYAWRIGARIGPESLEESILYSPVWSFTFIGTREDITAEQFMIDLTSPGRGEVYEEMPFFEWRFKDEADPNRSQDALEEGLYFHLKIWKLSEESVDGQADPLLIVNEPKLAEPYFSPLEIISDTVELVGSFSWQVTAIKEEQILAESQEQKFYVFHDKAFYQAALKVFDTVDLYTHSIIYGVIDPLEPGLIIQSEEPSDIQEIEVESVSYLFIADDLPQARFGHPVRYILVGDQSQSVRVYEADWFPKIKGANETWKKIGSVHVNDEVILVSRNETEPSTKPRTTDDELLIPILSIDCGNNAMLIDGGDYNRLSVTDDPTACNPCDVDSLQEYYAGKSYTVTRISQKWDNRYPGAKVIRVNPENNNAANGLRNMLLSTVEHYTDLACCGTPNLEFDLFVYINANEAKDMGGFKIYQDNGSDIHENISYYKDIFTPLQNMPQCVKLTFFIDACYSGMVFDSADYYLKRGNYEIITSSDARNTTDLPGCRIVRTYKTAVIGEVSKPDTVVDAAQSAQGRTLPGSESMTETMYAMLQLDKSMEEMTSQTTAYKENFGKARENVRVYAEQAGRPFPNPGYTSIHKREEFALNYPALSNNTAIKEIQVIPENAVNIIPDNGSGELKVFSKVEGQIFITVEYGDGSSETKQITSRWGDAKL
jgi:hypothetical protein